MRKFLFLLMTALLLCGCSGEEPAMTPVPTAAPAPTPTPDPWEIYDAEEAAEAAAGFGIRLPVMEELSVSYRVMSGALEAIYSDGDREVFRVCKTADVPDVSGDYSYTGQVMIRPNILEASLWGEGEDDIRMAFWTQNKDDRVYAYTLCFAEGIADKDGAARLAAAVAEDLPAPYVRGMNMPIAVGDHHTVALRRDGTVVAAGWNHYGQCDVEDWTDIVAVAAGAIHTVGLRSDGTVLVAGSDSAAQCRGVDAWSDIAVITADESTTYGFRSDGSLVYAGGYNDKRTDHHMLASIADSVELLDHSMFLCKDRKIHVVDWRGREKLFLWDRYLEEDIRSIRNIACTETSAPMDAWMHTFVMLDDGTVLTEYLFMQYVTGSTSDIAEVPEFFGALEIAGGDDFCLALMPDGTVSGFQWNRYGYWTDYHTYDTSRWYDILEIAADNGHCVGLRSDGTVVAEGDNEYGQCDVETWTDIGFPGMGEAVNEVLALSLSELKS